MRVSDAKKSPNRWERSAIVQRANQAGSATRATRRAAARTDANVTPSRIVQVARGRNGPMVLQRPACRLRPSVYSPAMTHVFVAPHPDDAALSCGGLIAGLRELGQSVTIL